MPNPTRRVEHFEQPRRRQLFQRPLAESDQAFFGQPLKTRGLPSVDVVTPYRSTRLDIATAKFLLGWRPEYDLPRLIEEAWNYQRPPDVPRQFWYPGRAGLACVDIRHDTGNNLVLMTNRVRGQLLRHVSANTSRTTPGELSDVTARGDLFRGAAQRK